MTENLLRVESLELLMGFAAFLAFAMIVPRPGAELLPVVSTSAPTMVALRIHGAGRVEMVRVPVPVVLGREQAVGLQIDDALVSRKHALIGIDDAGGAYLEDLGSRNGTLLNDRSVSREPLALGDDILIGTTRITFEGVGTWT